MPLNKSLNGMTHAAPAPGAGSNKKKEEKGKGGKPETPTQVGSRGRSQTPNPDESKEGDKPDACYNFQKGTCTRGAECRYSHAKDRGRSQTPTPKGGGKKELCKFVPLGTCKFGDKCKNSHANGGRSQAPAVVAVAVSAPRTRDFLLTRAVVPSSSLTEQVVQPRPLPAMKKDITSDGSVFPSHDGTTVHDD